MINALRTHAREHVCMECDGTGRASPRPFLVRWLDEDFGWKQLLVLATDSLAARTIVEQASGHVDLIVTAL